MSMNRILLSLRITLTILVTVLCFTTSRGQGSEAVLDGIIRLKVKPELLANTNQLYTTKSQGIVLTGIPSLDRLCKLYTATSIERVFPYSPLNDEKHRRHGLHLWYELRFSSKENALKVASAYASLNEVSAAEPLYQTKLITGQFKAMDNTASTASALPFNDPYLSKQWHYHNTGDFEGTPGSDINLFEAWKVTAGKPNVVVSVHDEGVDYTHEDLAANMWKNMAEYNGRPNVDDDNNGYIDDIYGYNFTQHSGNIDKMEHGTHVSGTIAAVNNNGKGVCGVAGGTGAGDGARIMSCQILGGSGSSNIPASYVYAADNGSLISQNSWGYTSPDSYEQAVLDAIDYFIAEAGNFAGSPMAGGVVIFAAGNDDANEHTYPGYYSSVVAVSSLGPTSQRAWYSNYGEWIDIASYGGDDTKHAQNQVLSTIPNNGYAYMQGTSMATPHVSGIAALILSKHGGPDFTNQVLLTHLLTGVRDVNSFNPDYIDLLGVGISDAALAVATDNQIAPSAIADLALNGISMDFATLQWTVPSDGDDNIPSSFRIYAATVPITPANLVSATMLTLPTKLDAGSTVVFEVDQLDPTTQYYFRVVAADRWGNSSGLSNEVNGSTNAGPSVALNPDHLDMTVDASLSSTAIDSFRILNPGEGVLKWTAQFMHKNLALPFNKSKLHYPAPVAQPASVKITLGKHRATAHTTGVPVGGDTFVPMVKDYYNYDGPYYVIGEENRSLTNSSATKFTVAEDSGFNLTQIQTLMAHDNNWGPMIMEVYIGSSLNTATLSYAQEVTSYDTAAYWHYVYLDDNIFMEKGTDFWVVFHVPAGNKYPLGMAPEREDWMSDNCFISTDMGKNWTPLATAIDDDRWVFVVSAVSDQPTLGNYITLNPAASSVLSGDSTSVGVLVDGTTLRNGSYSADIVISTNVKDNRLVKLPVNLEVTNHIPDLQVADILDFGSVFIGTEKSLDVAVSNMGYGDFSQVNVNISDPQFQLVGAAPWKIAARMAETISFKFKPANSGNSNATVTLTDVNGHSHQFYLSGVGSMPPIISLNPSPVTVNNLILGDEFKTSFTIQNTGQYPLKYAFSKFVDDNTLKQFGAKVQKFGYDYNVNLDGTGQPAFSFTDISTEPNIGKYFHYNQNDFYEVDLGFDFPFYGKTYSKVYITGLGAVCFANDGVLNRSGGGIGMSSLPSGYITAAWFPFDPQAGGGIYFQHLPGKMIVEYKNVVFNDPYSGKYPATFEIILYDNGNTDLVYEDLSAFDPFNLTYWIAGIDDPLHKDGVSISDVYNPIGITSNSIIRINNPGFGALKSVSSVSGVVPVGGSQAIDATFDTDSLKEGSFTEYISILSNDPFKNPAKEQVDFTITKGGTVQMSLDKDTVDFGTVFRTAVVKTTIALQNTGTKDLTITSMTLPGGKYTLDKAAPFLLKARETQYVTATLKTSAIGTFNAILTIKNNKAQTFSAHLFAKVVMEPIISVDIPSITSQLESGDSTKVAIKVSNNGQSPLEFTAMGTDWLYVPEDTAAASRTYSWITSTDPGGPTYNWIDILKTGVRVDSLDSYSTTKPWQGIKLPFNFRFYGKKYDSLYLSSDGLMTFTKYNAGYPWPVDGIPLPEEPNNFIAPLWIPGWYDGYAPDGGIYYQLYSDKVVVTYSKMINGFWMGDDISYQAILYNNGNIKFQYILANNDETSMQGVIGIENADGSDGVMIANKEALLRDKMAILVQPASKEIVPALSSKTIDAVVDARYLFAGNYSANLVLQNNTPANPNLQIPASLTVTGLPKLALPDSVAFGDVIPYQEADQYGVVSDKTYYRYFDVANPGKDKTIISTFTLKNASPGMVIETQVEDPFFGGFYWTDVNYLYDPLTIIPDTKASLRITFTPQGPAQDIRDTLVLSTNLPAGNVSIPISAHVIMPPVLQLSTDHLTVQADTTGHVETKTFIIDNSVGASALHYSMVIQYLRSKPDAVLAMTTVPAKQESQSNARIATDPQAVLAAAPRQTTAANTARAAAASLQTYNRILQYDTLSKASAMLGFNGSSEFWCASAFQAPDDGYTLSHVITWFAPGEWLSTDLVVEIRGGSDDINKSRLVFSQNFNNTVSAPDNNGQFLEIALDETLAFYPQEKFFVVVKYPFGLTYPQGTALLPQNLTKTFYYSSGDGTYYDLTDAGFASYGWMIKAAEKAAGPIGWASIIEPLSGTVEAGMQQSVDVVFKSRMAPDPDNYANVNISSNDPYHKESKVLLWMHRNQAPVFTHGSEKSLAIAENDTLHYVLAAVDPENDAFTYSLSENYNHVKIEQIAGKPTFTFATNFDMAGEYEFVVLATDTFRNISTQTLSVTVTPVNRAPVVSNQIPVKNYYKGSDPERVDLSEFFKDPDGDILTYMSSSSNVAVAGVFASGHEIMISPDNMGDAMIHVIATDPLGDSVSQDIVVHVAAIAGLENNNQPDFNVTAYPNPASEKLFLHFTGELDPYFTIRVINPLGMTMLELKEGIAGNQDTEIDISQWARGMYLIEINDSSGKRVRRIVKN